MSSIDNVMKNKLTNYNLAKGTLTQIQRKKTYVQWLFLMEFCNHFYSGSFAVRSLADIVPRESCIQNSEYLETLFVAVQKYAHISNCSYYYLFHLSTLSCSLCGHMSLSFLLTR